MKSARTCNNILLLNNKTAKLKLKFSLFFFFFELHSEVLFILGMFLFILALKERVGNSFFFKSLSVKLRNASDFSLCNFLQFLLGHCEFQYCRVVLSLDKDSVTDSKIKNKKATCGCIIYRIIAWLKKLNGDTFLHRSEYKYTL